MKSSLAQKVNLPTLGPQVPIRNRPFIRWIGRMAMRLAGWRFDGQLPDAPKVQYIGGPHTSNWDLPVMIASIFALDVDAKWLGKHTIFLRPYGWFFRWLGGIPVFRHLNLGVVEQTIEQYEKRDNFWLMIAPEGTRSKVNRWKTGFYHIAKGANVAIVTIILNFDKKTVGFSDPFWPTDDPDADLKVLQATMATGVGKRKSRAHEAN